jgi:hypothetical protein
MVSLNARKIPSSSNVFKNRYNNLLILFSLMNEVVHTSPTIGSNVEEVKWKKIFQTGFNTLQLSDGLNFFNITDCLEEHAFSDVGYRRTRCPKVIMGYLLC